MLYLNYRIRNQTLSLIDKRAFAINSKAILKSKFKFPDGLFAQYDYWWVLYEIGDTVIGDPQAISSSDYSASIPQLCLDATQYKIMVFATDTSDPNEATVRFTTNQVQQKLNVNFYSDIEGGSADNPTSAYASLLQKIGDISSLETTATDLVGAINEVRGSSSGVSVVGKTLVFGGDQ